MYQIAVFDDQPLVAEALKKMIEAITTRNHKEVQVIVCHSGEELLNIVSELEIIFLDIEMPQMDGIQVGKIIHERNPRCRIIMATGMVERFKEAFVIQAFRFITKPFQEKEVEEALLAAYDRTIGEETIEVYASRNVYHILQRDIIYIKAYSGSVNIYTMNQTFRKEVSMNHLLEQLDERLFAQIHKSYIVNLSFVKAYGDGELELPGKSLAVAKRERKEFERKMVNFDINTRGLL